jgi:hypothetical protein
MMRHTELINAADGPKTAYQAAADYGIDMSQLEYLLTISPLERVLRHDAARDLFLAAREAGIHYYGFDPRHPEAS